MNAWKTGVAPAALDAVELCLRFAQPSLEAPMIKSTQSGRAIKGGEAYEREFERYLVRFFLERQPAAVSAYLNDKRAQSLPVENRLVASLALEPRASAARVAELLPALTRPPNQEEVLRLAQFPEEPGVGEALKKVLQQPATSTAAIEALLKVRTKLDAAKLKPLLADTAKTLWAGDDASREPAVRLASGFKLTTLEPELVASLNDPAATPNRQLAALRALREMGSGPVETLAKLTRLSSNPAIHDEALAALGASKSASAPAALLELWPTLAARERTSALGALASTKVG